MLALAACGEDPPPASPAPSTAPVPAPAPAPAPVPAPAPEPVPTLPTEPTSFSAPFLWTEVALAGAPDLGHVPAPIATPAPAGPVSLVEATFDAGLFDSASGGAVQGVGVGFVDLDGDGWDDLVAINGSGPVETWASAAWRNQGDGTFADVSASSGLATLLAGIDGYSLAAGDVDADGDLDLYVGTHPADRLLLNAGDGTFSDGTSAAGAGGPPSAGGAGKTKIGVFGDYDADGILDVAVASNALLDAGATGYVLRGLGGGAFADVTVATGFAGPIPGAPCAVSWTDTDADGRDDLVIWSDLGDADDNRVLLRSDGVTLVDVHAAAGWTNPVGNPMGIDDADVDRDGTPDYLIGDFGTSAFLLSTAPGAWTDAAAASGLYTDDAWGLGFEDLDADGWWDVFVAQPSPDDHLVFTSQRTDPPSFSSQALPHGYLFPGNVPAAFADYDRDGDVDVVTGAVDGSPLSIWRNDTDRGDNRWLEVRAAVGARVVVSAGGVVTWRDVNGGGSRASQNAVSARFGLGPNTGADWVAVVWPNGASQVVTGVPGDTRLAWTEAGPVAEPVQ